MKTKDEILARFRASIFPADGGDCPIESVAVPLRWLEAASVMIEKLEEGKDQTRAARDST
jgi:hypothetical protein